MDTGQLNHNPNGKATRRHRYRWLVIAGLATMVLILARTFVARSDDRLFTPVTTPGRIQVDSADPASLRSRPVRINWQALGPETQTIRLNLFNDFEVTGEHVRTDHPVTGGFVWVGQVDGRPGWVTLSVQNGVLAGSVELLDRGRVIIASLPATVEGIYLIREVDRRAQEPNGPDTLLPPKPSSMPPLPETNAASCEEDGSNIDVMVVYSDDVSDLLGGNDAAEVRINQLISEMNTANDNSEAPFKWRLAAAKEVDYPESGNLSQDLTNLQAPNNGLLDQVHGWRDDVRADLVTMLVTEGNNNMCGIAFQMTDPLAWFESYAFSVTALDYPGSPTCGQLTMAHELGHTVGNAHDRDHTSIEGAYPYSYGYQALDGASPFRDIMAYDCPGGCPRINQWANPDVLYMGEPTGIDYETDPEHSADLVRSMANVRQVVANFRPKCATDPEPTAIPEPTNTPLPHPTDTPTPDVTVTPTPTIISPTATTPPNPTSPVRANQRYYLPLLIRR